MSQRRVQGKNDIYKLVGAVPNIFGRNSFIIEATSSKGSHVCIKVFTGELKSRKGSEALNEFLNEVQNQSTLEHPNILPIIEYGESWDDTGRPYIVYPFYRKTLRDVMDSADYLPIGKALPIVEQLAAAIDFAHEKGIVHGDIKPQNILTSESASKAVLADFGISKYFDVIEATTPVIAPSVAASTYMSPEQLKDLKCNSSSDIYSFAMVVYEMLVGALPFDDRLSPFRQMEAKINGAVTDPKTLNPHIGDDLAEALTLGLAVNPADRPATASGLCRIIGGHERPQKISSKQESVPGQKAAFWSGLSPSAKTSILVALIAAIGSIIVAAIELIPKIIDGQ